MKNKSEFKIHSVLIEKLFKGFNFILLAVLLAFIAVVKITKIYLTAAFIIYSFYQYVINDSLLSSNSIMIYLVVLLGITLKNKVVKDFTETTANALNFSLCLSQNLSYRPRNFKYNFELETTQVELPNKNGFPMDLNLRYRPKDKFENEKIAVSTFDSDWSCGRRQKCLRDIDSFTKNNNALTILNFYFSSGRAQNPALLPLTFKLLSKCSSEQKDWHLSLLISKYPLNFTLKQLRAIKKQIYKFQDLSRQSPLLITYLTGQHDKFWFYKKIGYSDNIFYKNCIISNQISDPSDFVYVGQVLKAETRYLGMTLAEVVNFERPIANLPLSLVAN